MDAKTSYDGPNFKGLLILLVIILAVGGTFAALWNNGKRQAKEDQVEITAKPEALMVGWAYSESKDPMTDGTTQSACVMSQDKVELQPPYEPVTADLCIRQSPQHGLDVMVALNGDGQMMCRSYDGCTVKVRFGEGEQQTFSAIGPADNSSNMVFIENPRRFLAAVKMAPITRIQATFYEAGNQVMEFKTADLEWPRPNPSPPA